MRLFDPIRSRSARIVIDQGNARRLAAFSSLTADAAEVIADELVDAPPVEASLWEGSIAFEGVMTGDGRMLEHGALTWPDDLSEANPLPFRTVFEDVGFHDNAFTTGRIFGIERRDGGVIWGWGDYDLGSEHGAEAARLLAENLQTGVSVDLDEIAFEVRVRADIIAEQDAFMEAMLNDGDQEGAEWTPPERREVDGYVVVDEGQPDDSIMVTMSAGIRSATQVAIPAFADARIAPRSAQAVDAPVDNAPADEAPAEVIVAAAAPVDPPRAWFDDPHLDGPTPLRVEDDGRVYGHLATWDTCHVASPAGEGICVTPPHSAKDYARFHLGSLLTAEGDVISVGKITMGTGHAGPRATPQQTAAHYDNTGAAVVDVRAGEDAYGIWVAGALRPQATDEQVRALRASPLSGDWRKVDGNLELHGALAVNVPGFPVIPRPSGLVASGELMALTAAAMVIAPEQVQAATATFAESLDDEDLAALRRLAAREREQESIARQNAVHAFAARQRVAAFAASRHA